MAVFQCKVRAQDAINVLIGKNRLVAFEERLLKVLGLVADEAGRRWRRGRSRNFLVAADS
jgi:hypothetical protein